MRRRGPGSGLRKRVDNKGIIGSDIGILAGKNGGRIRRLIHNFNL